MSACDDENRVWGLSIHVYAWETMALRKQIGELNIHEKVKIVTNIENQMVNRDSKVKIIKRQVLLGQQICHLRMWLCPSLLNIR